MPKLTLNHSYQKGDLQEIVRRRLEAISAERGKYNNVVFADDPKKGMEAYHALNDVLYIEQHMKALLDEALAKLSEEQREKFKDVKEPEALAAGLEDALGEDAARELTERMGGIVSPTDPEFNMEEQTMHPRQARIQHLKEQLDPNDPDRAEKEKLLDEVNQDLGFLKKDVVEFSTHLDNTTPFPGSKLQGMTTDVDRYNNSSMKPYFEQLGVEKRFPKDGKLYSSAYKQGKTALTEEDFQTFRTTDHQLSEKLTNKAVSIMKMMDEIGAENFMSSDTSTLQMQPDGSTRKIFAAEQGGKKYGFSAYAIAKKNLLKAVDDGDLNKIREAKQKFDHIHTLTDKMFETVKNEATSPLFCGNLNSTRTVKVAQDIQESNELPSEYLLDYTTQNQLNGVFMLYAFCKNYDVKPEELLKDPVNVVGDLMKRHARQNGLGEEKKKSTAEVLTFALSLDDETTSTTMSASYNNFMYLTGRGLEGLSGFAENEEERARLVAASNMALMTGSYEYSKEEQLIETIQKMDEEKAVVFYTAAILSPEGEFDPRSVAQTLQEEDWQQKLDAENALSGLRAAGKLDLRALAEHTEKLLEDASKQSKALADKDQACSFDRRLYRKAAAKSMETALATATPEERESPGYKKMSETLKKMNVVRVTDSEMSDTLDENLAILKERKTGLFTTSKNSPEHVRMTDELSKLQNKLKLLRGEKVEGLDEAQRQELASMDLGKQMKKAREATYNYYRIKNDGGKSTSFWSDAGLRRSSAAGEIITAIDKLSDELGMRTPAEKVIQDTQRELMENRGDKQWMRENGELCAAKIVRAQMVAEKTEWSAEKQRYALSGEKMTAMAEKIRQSEEFQRMLRKQGIDKTINSALLGGGENLVTDMARAMGLQGSPQPQQSRIATKTKSVQTSKTDTQQILQ